MPVLSGDGTHRVTIVLNGARVSADAAPRTLLSDHLRHALGATGTHVGCEHGVCGACTVRVDGAATRSCLMYAVQADGRRVDTVEGLSGPDGKPGRLQESFRRHFALQCGFCTPGILMSLSQFLEENADPSEEELRDMLSGHLCRCTGYSTIVKAALAAAKKGDPDSV